MGAPNIPARQACIGARAAAIRWVTPSPCGKRNYSRHKNLRKTPPKNFKTGSFDRSDTSPLV